MNMEPVDFEFEENRAVEFYNALMPHSRVFCVTPNPPELYYFLNLKRKQNSEI